MEYIYTSKIENNIVTWYEFNESDYGLSNDGKLFDNNLSIINDASVINNFIDIWKRLETE